MKVLIVFIIIYVALAGQKIHKVSKNNKQLVTTCQYAHCDY